MPCPNYTKELLGLKDVFVKSVESINCKFKCRTFFGNSLIMYIVSRLVGGCQGRAGFARSLYPLHPFYLHPFVPGLFLQTGCLPARTGFGTVSQGFFFNLLNHLLIYIPISFLDSCSSILLYT
jgi:hypothetical protein